MRDVSDDLAHINNGGNVPRNQGRQYEIQFGGPI